MSKKVKVGKYVGVYYLESEKRRHNGKPDRSFWILFNHPLTGKKIWQRIGWASEGYSAAYAHQKRGEEIQKAREGKLISKKTQATTVGAAFQDYLKGCRARGVKKVNEMQADYNNHLKVTFDSAPLLAITTDDLINYQDALMARVSASTAWGIMRMLKAAFNRAFKKNKLHADNPFEDDDYQLPEFDNVRERFFTEEEVDRLLDYLNKDDRAWYNIVLLTLNTGMRWSEVRTLRWRDIIDFGDGMNEIETPVGNSSSYAFIHRKHYKKKKKVFLNEVCERILDEQRSRLQEEGRYSTSGYIFPNTKNGPIKHWCNLAYARALDALKINEGAEDNKEKAVFHTLRHTFASWLVLKGESMRTIMELMGHKHITATERYIHLMPSARWRAVSAMAGVTSKFEKAPAEPTHPHHKHGKELSCQLDYTRDPAFVNEGSQVSQ